MLLRNYVEVAPELRRGLLRAAKCQTSCSNIDLKVEKYYESVAEIEFFRVIRFLFDVLDFVSNLVLK